ncbi:MAG: STAS domain-containing protein, partial [Betaproteobacteria bacterium]|nr:STAS domain-containing protein [Betaproteobacteria bacterium]
PVAALGAVLMQASFGLMNLPALREFWRLDRHEFGLSIIVTLGVVWVGAIQAIVLAVVLAVLRFVQIAARPLAEVLGEVPGHPGFHSLTRHPDAQVPPGLVLFRFNGPLVFFNAPYFKRSVFEALDRAGPGVKWFVIDMLPMPYTDITGMQTARELLAELKTRGIELVTAGRVGEMLELSQLKGISEAERLPIRRFSTLRKALQAFKAKQNQAATSPE